MKAKGETEMDIFTKLKAARIKANLTQEMVAEKLQVSRQTISNWENGKTYPDIISVIALSDIYAISLDALLKGDEHMIAHLEKSTNIVKSNTKLITLFIINIVVFALMMLFNSVISNNKYLMVAVLLFVIVNTTVLFYQVIRKF